MTKLSKPKGLMQLFSEIKPPEQEVPPPSRKRRHQHPVAVPFILDDWEMARMEQRKKKGRFTCIDCDEDVIEDCYCANDVTAFYRRSVLAELDIEY